MCICMTDKGDKCKCHTDKGVWQAKQISISHPKLLREKIKRWLKRMDDMGKVHNLVGVKIKFTDLSVRGVITSRPEFPRYS